MGSIYSIIHIAKAARYLMRVSGCDKQLTMWYNFNCTTFQNVLIGLKHFACVLFSIIFGFKFVLIIVTIGFCMFIIKTALYDMIKYEQQIFRH